MELIQVENALLDSCVDAEWDDCLAYWEEGTPEQKAEVRAFAAAQREAFLQMARDVDDGETLQATLALRYIELKCHWIMLNTGIQFRTVSGAEPDMATVYRASLVSMLLKAFESLLDFDDLERITQFLAQPIHACDASLLFGG